MTLLEVAIATSILAILSIYTSETVQRAVKSKVKIEKDVDRVSTVRDALKIIERDVNMAFNYRDINIDLYNISEKERLERLKKGTTPKDPADPKTDPDPNPDPTTASPKAPTKVFKPKEQKILTHFLGEENKVDFTTLTYTRTRDDDKASDQAEVGYAVKSCRNRFDKKRKANVFGDGSTLLLTTMSLRVVPKRF